MEELKLYPDDLKNYKNNKCAHRIKSRLCNNIKYQKYNYCYIHYHLYLYDKPEECPICFEKLENKDILSCGHYVHKNCVIKWGKKLCPVCKTEIKLSKKEMKLINEHKHDNDDNDFDTISRIFSHQLIHHTEFTHDQFINFINNFLGEYYHIRYHHNSDDESSDNESDSDEDDSDIKERRSNYYVNE